MNQEINMKKILKMTNNEQGFVLVASLMMLMVLMIIGIAATNTTTLELQISGNDRLAKQVFYRAEGVIAETLWDIRNTADDPSLGLNSLPWLHSDSAAALAGRLAPATESADVHDDAFWAANAAVSALPAPGLLQRIAVDRGAADDYGLGEETVPYRFDVYGRNQQNNAFTAIKASCQIPITW